MQTNPAVQQSNKKLRYLEEHSASVVLMGVEHRGTAGGQVPPEFGAGDCPPPDFVMLHNFKQQITCIRM